MKGSEIFDKLYQHISSMLSERVIRMTVWLNELLYEVSMALDYVEHELIGAEHNHSKRVAYLCLEMAAALSLPPEQISDICGCAVLHDNALTEYILSENGGNPHIQQINLKSHCVIGEENATHFPFLTDVTGNILYHHENADGTGPFGLRGTDTPLGAALIRIADHLDVRYNLSELTASKRKELNHYVAQQAGKFYTPLAAGTLVTVLDRLPTENFRNENIGRILLLHSPRFEIDCSDKQLINFASIIAKIIDYKSRFTSSHSIGIAKKAYHMAEFYGYDSHLRAQIFLAAALHDIGKLSIPNAILEKPGKLTDKEFFIIKQHAIRSYQMLDKITGFEKIRDWGALHHEKLNGKGYPFGKTGESLDHISRLIACIDIYQAVSEERPYHPANSHDKTMAVLKSMAEKGLIDAQIVADLDHELSDSSLEDRQPQKSIFQPA